MLVHQLTILSRVLHARDCKPDVNQISDKIKHSIARLKWRTLANVGARERTSNFRTSFRSKEKEGGTRVGYGGEEKRFLQKTREGEGGIFVEKCLEADKIGPRLIVSRICVNRKEAIATVETARLCLNNTR